MNILVTRHNETIKLFWDLKIIDENTEILDHIDDKNIHKIIGKNVIGILPFDLAAKCNTLLTPIWDIPLDARGADWTYEDTKKYFKGMKKYKILEIT